MAIRKNFVVKNGLEVDERILYVDAFEDKVGIGTINPEYEAHVIGAIGCTDLIVTRNTSISGILTANELNFTGDAISVGDTTGLPGQYLRSTGSGVEWASFPTNLRSTFTYTATDLQTTFDYAYNPGFLDVFINGVKLKGNGVTDVSEYTAVNGVNVVLTEPAFAGDFVEFIAYNPSSVAAGAGGILGITVQEEGTVIGNDNGIASINFIGAAVTAVGSGVGVTVYISGGSGSGIVVREESVILGSDITSLNFVGTSVTATASGAGATVYITDSNAGAISSISEDTTPLLGGNLDLSGNNISGIGSISVSGIITANSFEVNGGFSTQFLKADGSLDSNTYLTSYTETSTIDDVLSRGNSSSFGANLGVVTATSFVGDGSGLFGVVAVGSGIAIEDDDSLVGVALTVNFGENILVTPVSSGIVTVTSTGGDSYWESTPAGISTITSVGVATTSPQTTFQVEIYGVKTGLGTFSASAGTLQNIDTFTISQTDFKTLEYTVHVGLGSYIQSQKILAMQNGENAYYQEYAIMYDQELIVSVGATVSSGDFNLYVIPESGFSGLATYRFVRQTIL